MRDAAVVRRGLRKAARPNSCPRGGSSVARSRPRVSRTFACSFSVSSSKAFAQRTNDVLIPPPPNPGTHRCRSDKASSRPLGMHQAEYRGHKPNSCGFQITARRPVAREAREPYRARPESARIAAARLLRPQAGAPPPTPSGTLPPPDLHRVPLRRRLLCRRCR